MIDHRQRLLSLYDEFPFERHPLWLSILERQLSLSQVLRAEIQHFIRTKSGQALRRQAVRMVKSSKYPRIYELLLETYLEECTDKAGPSHLDLIKRLLTMGGVDEGMLDEATPTPPNSAAIALYREITNRGGACHMLGAGTVEHYYSKLAPRIFEVYTGHYGMSPAQAETYRLHGPMDAVHAQRAFDILGEAIELHGWPMIEQSVREAFFATSLHYDGMFQAATGQLSLWSGRT